MRIVVLGGYGNFGARICRALAPDRSLTIVASGRHTNAAPADFSALGIATAAVDISSTHFYAPLASLKPGLVIHCVGPFQGQDYRVAHAALACGAHYIDLSDGREFVAGFGAAVNDAAEKANRLAVTGASTLPALSSAVVDACLPRFSAITSIDSIIAPAQTASRRAVTLAGVLSYAGKPFSVWEQGAWHTGYGWQDVQKVDVGPVGSRLSAVCDVPDLALFPARYAGVQNVRFRAALDVGVQHRAISLLAALRRRGLTIAMDKLAPRLDAIANWLDPFGSNAGAMTLMMTGIDANGRPLRLRWHVHAPGNDGPEIPCMAAILLARKLSAGSIDRVGAMPCMGLVALDEFTPEFVKWKMTTAIEELP
ncbi:MAG: saccharopine dehydrogenase NADP-binding domain-containing protein [Usitatibacteraceae bacterium]